jgi:cytochrome c553
VIAAMLLSNLHKIAITVRRWLGMVGILSLYHPLSVFADGMFTDMAAPYESCGYCHEYDGNPSMGNYPKVAGQKKAYIIKQMLDYRSGRRDGRGMMGAAASLLSDQDLQTVAEFFAKQKPTLDKATVKDSTFAHARDLWLHGAKDRMINACVLCHTSSDEPEIPYLRGQHAEYLEDQLRAFKNKTRTNDEVGIMQFFAERLSNEEITQLSQFIAAGAGQP